MATKKQTKRQMMQVPPDLWARLVEAAKKRPGFVHPAELARQLIEDGLKRKK